jgi:serine protease Do
MPVDGFGDIAEKLRRSTVRVSAGRRVQGSGIILSSDGIVVTNAHVAASGRVDVELWDGTRSQADLLLSDVGRDLAILQFSRSSLPAAVLADSDRVRVGELVIAVGSPFGFMGALTTGVIHAIGPVPNLGPLKWIQADVRLAPGNSGGPLANARGEVIGINTMIAGGVGLAIPSNSVSRLLRTGFAPAPLGVVVRPVQVAVRGRARLGLAILEVCKDGVAASASLMPGDVLIGVEGSRLESIEDFERVLDGAGERTARLQFLRGDPRNIRTVTVRLGSLSTAAA